MGMDMKIKAVVTIDKDGRAVTRTVSLKVKHDVEYAIHTLQLKVRQAASDLAKELDDDDNDA